MYRLPDIGAAPPFSGTVVVGDEGVVLGSVPRLDFFGDGVEVFVSGSFAGVQVRLQKTFALNFIIGNGSSVLTTGSAGAVELGVSGTFERVRVWANETGSFQADLRIGPFASLPFGAAQSIVHGDPPTLNRQRASEDNSIPTWSASFGRGNWLEVFVTTGSSVKQVTLCLGGRII